MAGHLFVLRGNVTELQCSAILIPCDHNWELVWDYWSTLLEPERFERSPWGAQLMGGGGPGRFFDVAASRDRRIRLVVTADGRSDPHWVEAGVVEAIQTFASDLPRTGGRVKPLVALPLVGTGAGGFRNKRGLLINVLLPALRKVATDTNIDVALVLRYDRDHAAIQGQRSASDWSEFSAEYLDLADELGARAARQELSLFLGSGVSVPLGLPDWEGLLADISGEQVSDYSTETAPCIAQRLQEELGTERLHTQIAERLNVSGFAPAHLLLAGLAVRQTVTTNYDTAYETALDGSCGADGYCVLTRQLAVQPNPWLLKIHGDVRRPESVVITTDDYARLDNDHPSLHALVESLLMTSHLMFVGYSMGDRDFVQVADRVRKVRALADDDAEAEFATVLALHPGAVSQQAGFTTIAMLEGSDDEAAARRLEIFLDRISWAAARHRQRSHVYLLDPNYEDLFANDPPTTRLRNVLAELSDLAENDPARRSPGWAYVEAMLADLGGRPSQ
jgi:hypothetical protein